MKERYIELMEKALSAYTDEHILRYLNDVKTNGLTEHGFPRLTSNIGILIAHGRRKDLLPIFVEMMDVCCKMFLRPYVHAANEFSVREVLSCIAELEAAGVVDAEVIAAWKRDLAAIEPEKCYNSYEKALSNRARNWAFFLSLSELFRQNAGLCESSELIDSLLEQQMQWFDENGMYRDNKNAVNHQPVMYDIVTRGLCCLLLHFGYDGKYRDQIDGYLKKAALMTLKMQSPNGEIPFGGRSNQFLNNEAWLMMLFEYEARRYAKEGNTELVKAFKAAITRALNVIEYWIGKQPIHHVKNRFPIETKYGCEGYGYFDKYMITVASFLYAAYLLHDDSIPTEVSLDHEPAAFHTTEYFHKLFLKSGGYAIEFDLDADPSYDANGLGRVHREGAPSTVCLSCPCPAEPDYTVDTEKPFAFSLCSAVREKDGWLLGADGDTKYEVSEYGADNESASATLLCKFSDNRTIREHYTVNESGVSITVEGDGEIGYALPAFCFDGEVSPKITVGEHSLTVSYEGFICRYTTNGKIVDLNKIAANRNGHYRVFIATSQNTLDVKIEITKA
ncbi:MAG: hypothetical protein IJX46_09550 [Clostridia bacterium]|nr:hypothetical protein [Clostridia bacterium]